MAAPVDPPSADRFIQMLTRSGLLEPAQLRRAIDAAPVECRRDAKKLADYLVDRQSLTQFQAAKLLQGAWHGLTLGPYQVLAPLGRGGMSTVYLARNKKGDKGKENTIGMEAEQPPLVALKVLPPKRAQAEERTLARFRREMDMGRLVSHPHLTRTFDAGEIQGVYYIAMEYIRGQSLSQAVKADGPLSAERAARLFSEIAAGLTHAHAKGLIHRDLKPSNIMVTPNGHAKILDLGLAFVIDEELPLDKMIVGGQGYVVGTMDYIAPEQVDDPTRIDGRADLYSFGCSLFFALTGQPPFPGGTSKQKMQRHQKEFAEPIPDLNPTVPAEFARIVEKLMEKDPARRYRSAAQARDALLPWAAGDPERPLDVDPMLSEAEAIKQLEDELRSMPHPWWESVPVVSFEATAKHGGPLLPPSEQNDPRSAYQPLIALAIVVGLTTFVLLVELIRR